MKKRLSYRKARKGVAEQYNVSINQDIIRSLGITPNDRTIEMFYDRVYKKIVIRKV
jgi:protein-arginine kinase